MTQEDKNVCAQRVRDAMTAFNQALADAEINRLEVVYGKRADGKLEIIDIAETIVKKY